MGEVIALIVFGVICWLLSLDTSIPDDFPRDDEWKEPDE